MFEPDEAALGLPAALLERADSLARQLDLPRARVFELALAALEREAADQLRVPPPEREISQGEVFWIEPPDGALAVPERGYHRHPYVVIQDDILNRSRLPTVVVCALTTNVRQAKAPGNVLLEPGEAGLPKQSVVDVAKVSAVAKAALGERIGALSEGRVRQILAGMRFLQLAFFAR
ncbi:MAG TPA: type II toxin-antitoxin system PemK/MazF family toxin [Herpetosiphonaceae bacterium]